MIRIRVRYKELSKWRKRAVKVCFVVLILAITQAVMMWYQNSRYYLSPDRQHDYCCVQMSRDVEGFFEGMGIHTYVVVGCDYEETNDSSFKWCNETFKGVFESGHMWCLVDFGLFKMNYESTYLAPKVFNMDYKSKKISEGFFKDGKWRGFNGEDELDWKPYP